MTETFVGQRGIRADMEARSAWGAGSNASAAPLVDHPATYVPRGPGGAYISVLLTRSDSLSQQVGRALRALVEEGPPTCVNGTTICGVPFTQFFFD